MHTRTYRILRVVLAATLLLIGVAAAFSNGSDEQTEPVSEPIVLEVGYMPILPVAQFFVAEGEGWNGEAGVNFNLNRFPDGPSMVQALASGKLDVMHFGIGPAMVARSRGQDIRVVASSIIEQIGFIANETLAAYFDPDDPATLFADFESGEGRKAKIATFPQGSVPDTVLRYWLVEVLGVGIDAVEILGMGADRVQQALLTDAVDGASILEPVMTIVQERSPATRVLVRATSMFPGQPGAVLAVREGLIEEHPDVVEELVRIHIRATEFLRSEIEASAEHIVEFIGQGLVQTDTIESALRSPSTNYMADPRAIREPAQRMHDFQLASGSIQQAVNLDELFDMRFYESATQ